AADTADALGGHASRERALEIMRDSRIGTYGAAALILSVGLRWAALASLAPVEGALALVIAHSASRGLMVPATRLARYARPSGTAKGVGAGAGMGEFLLALAPGMILAAWIAPQTLVAVALGAGAGVLILGLLVRRLGGYTGDGLGAIQQAAEVTIMVALAGLLR
ncbi:MAG: adenosylcobinamide-GDP ribazoletransferase, partial [Pseudomonadota bacterium]